MVTGVVGFVNGIAPKVALLATLMAVRIVPGLKVARCARRGDGAPAFMAREALRLTPMAIGRKPNHSRTKR